MGGGTIKVFGFPSDVSADMVKEFLEIYTGEGTVCALKVRPPKSPGAVSAFVVVQFTSSEHAENITSIATKRNLCYAGSYLTTRNGEHDIVQKPKTFMFNLEHVVLHLGCQISNKEFYALWSCNEVEVNFGFGLQKIEFYLTCCGVHYKLELFYESIWQFFLRRSIFNSAKFLLIQVQEAPRIYKKLNQDDHLNYYKETNDDQWVREVDFTPSSLIGQSTMLCLEVPNGCKLPDISKDFMYYKMIPGPFSVVRGFSFSHGLDLVPVVAPSCYNGLPYKILFQVNRLVQIGIILGPTLDNNFYRLVDPSWIPIRFIEHALEHLSQLKDSCFRPAKWLCKQYAKYFSCPPRSTAISLDPGLVYVRRVEVTPSKVYFCGPEVNVSNRVLRHFSDYIDDFIRVSFVDEGSDKLWSTHLIPKVGNGEHQGNGETHTGLYTRILTTLRNGIVIGNRKFEFLAFSSSQLRENSVWMFAAREGLDAEDIRRWMGDFSGIRNVAKYSARLGQSFGSSTETLSVLSNEVGPIPDIKTRDGKYNFSDGIGKISVEFAKRVAHKCDIRGPTPSAFQIRYGGYKGVVAQDPRSSYKLSLRDSMCKFKSENTKLDVLGWSKYQPCYLNRQLITLLSTLGVEDHIFERKQREVVDELDMILTNPIKARETLEIMSPGEIGQVLREMLLCGYKPDGEPFLSMILEIFRATKLLELRTKTKIFIPNGRAMMGCLDETRTLESGQVFVKVSRVGNQKFFDNNPFMIAGSYSDEESFVIEGEVVVAKNPCLHPGDIRVLQAVNVPALHHMVDCVVFPQKGRRPHPNECSGSDLDGDIYFVSWDIDLIPLLQAQPMDYRAPPLVLLDRDVEIEDIEEYFTNYMVNDSLGIIANAHIAFADKEPAMANSEACVELAHLFSIAVDFPKTGVPAKIPPHLHGKEYPDFMENPHKPTYESHRVIGKLYREVKDKAPDTKQMRSFTKEVAAKSYDRDMEVEGFKDYIDDAYLCKGRYDFKLGNLMDQYGIKTEAEIISGSIMKMSKAFTRNKDVDKKIALAVKSLRNEARGWFEKKESETSPLTDDEVYAKASAWYHVTYHPSYHGIYNEGLNRPHFISFPWCVYEKLIQIKQKKIRVRKQLQKTRMQRQVDLSHYFNHSLMLDY